MSGVHADTPQCGNSRTGESDVTCVTRAARIAPPFPRSARTPRGARSCHRTRRLIRRACTTRSPLSGAGASATRGAISADGRMAAREHALRTSRRAVARRRSGVARPSGTGAGASRFALSPGTRPKPVAHAGDNGSRPLRSSGRNGPGSAINERAASTWPHVFHSRTPRTRPPSR